MEKLLGNLMKEVESWEKKAKKYRKMGMESDHNKFRQESLLCESDTLDYCAKKVRIILEGK